MKRLLVIVFVVAILAVGLNDVSRWAAAQRNLTGVTQDLATRAADELDNKLSRDQIAADIAQVGAAQGVTVYQYDQSAQGVAVWTQTSVTKTIVLGPGMALLAGVPFKDAKTAPYVIRSYKTAGI
jgi:hypothetical protein